MSKEVLQIKILGLCINIIYTDDVSRADNCMEICDSKTLEIFINKNMPEENKRLTLLHEVIHMISDLLNLDLNESQVCGLSVALG
jgi:Zn-dependent peptidase ImmA (M78 family)